MDHSLLLWTVFNIFIISMLIIDLTVFHNTEDKETIRRALIWTGVWIAMALLFGVGVYYFMGTQIALDYYTGYLIEKSLSVDNIFVFLLVFSYFQVPAEYQHKVLFWGIFGALIMRLLFILLGVALLQQFHWIIYIFGAFLVFTGIKLAREKDKEVHPEKNPVLKLFRRFYPTTKSYHGSQFFIRRMGKFMATPLFIVLIVIETTDVVFALDSIPAILAITQDEFIIYSSNAFAILGLRALYFAVSGVMRLFHYLHYGLSLILVFVGIKMLLSELYHIPTPYALGFIAITLAISIIASIIYPQKEEPLEEVDLPDE